MKSISHKSIVAVERERERESYTLVKQSIVLLIVDLKKIVVKT